jgi:hypothetical protein
VTKRSSPRPFNPTATTRWVTTVGSPDRSWYVMTRPVVISPG